MATGVFLNENVFAYLFAHARTWAPRHGELLFLKK